MKKILILDAHLSQAMALAKYISQNKNFYLVGCVEEAVRFNVTYYDEVLVGAYDEVSENSYSYILPMGAKSTYSMVQKYKVFSYENGITFSQTNLIAFDKATMLSMADKLEVPIPKTYFRKEEIKKLPIFYKEDFEQGGGLRGIAYKVDDIPDGKLLYQEYIDTPFTYGVGFLAKEGEILTYTIHKEVLSYPKEGGSAVVIEIFEDKKLLYYVQKLIKELDYNGWGLAEFKYCNEREDYIFMEINAKFWASIEFMLINNPIFLRKLFNIGYNKKNISQMLFVNRLFQYKFLDIFRNLKYLSISYKIYEDSLWYQGIRKIMPKNIISLLKAVVK